MGPILIDFHVKENFLINCQQNTKFTKSSLPLKTPLHGTLIRQMLTYHSTKQVLSVVLHIWIPVAFSTYRLSSMCGHSVYTTGSESIPLLLFLLPPVYRGKRSPCLLFLFLFLLPLKTLAPTPRLLPAIWECVHMWG